MSEAPQTFAQWSAYGGLDVMSRAVINTLIANDPLLAEVPLLRWPGGKSYEWILNSTGPTISAIDETSTLESTQVLRKSVSTYLSQYGGEVEIPIYLNSTMNAAYNLELEDMADLVRKMGQKISAELIQGNWMTEASDVTIVGSGIAATPGIDAVVAISANMPTGYGDIFYDHSATSLQFRAPGSTTLGAAVDISGGDGNFTLYDGDDTTKYVTLTIDISDYTTGAVDLTHNGALIFLRPDEVAGLKELAALDSAQVKTPSTNGDALTLTHLDELEEMVLGPKSEKVFLMNSRTRRAAKHLIAAAGGMQQGEYQDQRLSKYSLNYEGVPIVAAPNVVINETQGSATTCGRVYCVRLNPSVGLHMFYGPMSGPNMGTARAVSDHDAEGGAMELPVYLRKLGEFEDRATFKWRISAALAVCLRRSTSCAMRYGITS